MHAPVFGEVEILPDALVGISADGHIESVQQVAPAALDGLPGHSSLHTLDKGQYLLPGLVDLHIHAPQWPQLGKALHLPLNRWLQEYTFPLESRYEDLAFAAEAYESLVDNLLANGTTTAAYYGTVHLQATCLLADVAQRRGQRAFVGKVAMDNPDQCPDFYRDASTAAGLNDTRALIEYVNAMDGDLVRPVVTPRFIPSCTDDMLDGLARIADEYGCHVQTHCSESDWEHRYVLDRHGLKDTQSLERIGLLTDKTILAHGVLVDNDDLQTIRSRQSGIAHCPLSNIYLAHAVFPARRALDMGLKVGLGTDIAGGPSPSILHNCRVAVSVSRALEDGVDPLRPATERGVPGARINFREAFWMATVGGAKSLGINVGRFQPGYAFDAIVVDTNVTESNLVTWEGMDDAGDILQKIIYSAERRNIRNVWVQGRLVRS